MKAERAPDSRRESIWLLDIEHPCYEHAHNAMIARPDYPEFERLWAALDERYQFMKYDFDPEEDDNLLYQTDLTELAEEAGIDTQAALSHLVTMQGAGLILAVVAYQEYNSVSVVIAPQQVTKS